MAQTTVVHPVQRERRGAAYLARCRNAIRGLSLPRVLFFAVIGAFTVFYVVHLSMLHDRFWTTGYDLGIFDQATWLVAQGKTFITILGLTFWGHHVNPGLVLFAPFIRIGGYIAQLIAGVGDGACDVTEGRVGSQIGTLLALLFTCGAFLTTGRKLPRPRCIY